MVHVNLRGRARLPGAPACRGRWFAALPLLILLPLLATCARPARGSPPEPASAEIASLVPPLDPMQPGPYPVGAVARAVRHRSITTGEWQALDTVIWYPASASAREAPRDPRVNAVRGVPVADGSFPVVVFSHAAASSPVQSVFLTTHLASYGFVVAAPSHPGSRFEDCLGCGDRARMEAMLADSAANRPSEVSAVLDALSAMNDDQRSPFHGALDTGRAAVIGHSWGGYTAITTAAADPRFQAAVAMAPVVNVTVEEAEQRLRVPVLVMGSRLDDVTPFAPQERLFRLLPAGIPRYLIAFPFGGHTAYSEVCPVETPGCRPGELGERRGHELVSAYVTSFLRRYLTGDDRGTALLTKPAGSDLELTAMGPR